MVFAGLMSSCDMETKPFGTLDDETGVEKLADVESFRNNLYSALRGKTAGSWIRSQEIQMDIFHGLKNNGNNDGDFSNGTINSADQDVEDFWASMYSTINQANFIIEKIDNFVAAGVDEKDLLAYNRYKAEACFTRAFCYTWLADHFCVNISSANAQTPAMGIPLKLKYEPSANRGTYPGRSTLQETFDVIDSDLATAYDGLKAWAAADTKNAPVVEDAYLNYLTVAALQARVALLKADKATAYAKATEVINSGVYSLTEIADYSKLWSEDTGSEIIFRPVMTNTEGLVSTGGTYFLSDNEESAYFIPTDDALLIYDDNDIRFDAFFTVYQSLKVDGVAYPCYVFNKFPGNEALKTGTQRNFCNMMKPFRLSEMYLIAAETAADANTAATYLKALRAKRLVGYDAANDVLSASNITTAVREERFKELMGEGFRMSDLRRWHVGFERNPEHVENPDLVDIITAIGLNVTYVADDYRYVWPIPAVEIQTNPQLDGQQNPGY